MIQVNIDVILNSSTSLNFKNSILSVVQSYLESKTIAPSTIITNFDEKEHPAIHGVVKAIIIDVPNCNDLRINFASANIKWYLYTMNDNGPIAETDEGDEEEHNLYTQLILPSTELFNLWENLYYDANIKEHLLQYAKTMMEFADKGVDPNVVSCNRVILLHGPPGTGKTSLCKALAQKLTVRMQERYSSGIFIEVNSHSLFSKWFSESGKLVTKMFSKIKQIVAHSNLLVCVLIDEIESLAHARAQCMSGNEPSDSIRVVNAILTQIDQIKKYPNVLIFATSNMTEAIDLAFVDRADIKQFLGLPSVQAIYKIYSSCIQELIKAEIITTDLKVCALNVAFSNSVDNKDKCTSKLLEVCERSIGLSGRSLRKIPFLAHALFLNSSKTDLYDFLVAMLEAVEREKSERKYFE